MNRFSIVLCALVISGCGVSDGTELRDLDEDDWQKLCEEQEEETFTCDLGAGGSYEITFGGSDCTPEDSDGALYEWPEGCTATVGDWRDCDEAFRASLRADECSAETPAECSWMETCIVLE